MSLFSFQNSIGCLTFSQNRLLLVHISWNEETIHSAEINDTPYERAACFHRDEAIFFLKKKFKKKLIFQLHQFSIFFHENFMDWSLG